ncbi:hypothetical protein HPP92_027381 [Vanilla planifolia]|uniref:Protein kinase domain-containing protein n=1 Tax=Vanilla planifolia TaxID=51239 RepID=A0A835PBY5_VANPL|nr:hypothetical protein HPP92_027381 [Vanilla planifolia]
MVPILLLVLLIRSVPQQPVPSQGGAVASGFLPPVSVSPMNVTILNHYLFFLSPLAAFPGDHLSVLLPALISKRVSAIEFDPNLDIPVALDVLRQSPGSLGTVIQGNNHLVKSTAGQRMEDGVAESCLVGDIAGIVIFKNSDVLQEKHTGGASKHFIEHLVATIAATQKNNSSIVHLIRNRRLISTAIPNRRIRLAAKTPPSTSRYPNTFVRIAIPAAAILAALSFAVYTRHGKWIRIKIEEAKKTWRLRRFRKFNFREIERATNIFHSEFLIGRGATSDVYRVTVPGSPIAYAIKLFRRLGCSKPYSQELRAISRVRHGNILELRGWCDGERRENVLVYNLMPNGSLDDALHTDEGQLFPWSRRYNVAVKIASALRYLHDDCTPQILHCDIKSSNVLLDADYEPKLADFGLALCSSPYVALGSTIEYAAPEFGTGLEVDASSDVYSYGVLVLEICCGRKPRGLSTNLVNAVREKQRENRLVDAADQRLVELGDSFDPDELVRLLMVGLACTVEEKRDRPSMSRVLQMLSRESSASSSR